LRLGGIHYNLEELLRLSKLLGYALLKLNVKKARTLKLDVATNIAAKLTSLSVEDPKLLRAKNLLGVD
jgi:hypothetical protein